MGDKHWIQRAVPKSHQGDLHEALHIAAGKPIPLQKLEEAAHSKDAHLREMAQFALNVRK